MELNYYLLQPNLIRQSHLLMLTKTEQKHSNKFLIISSALPSQESHLATLPRLTRPGRLTVSTLQRVGGGGGDRLEKGDHRIWIKIPQISVNSSFVLKTRRCCSSCLCFFTLKFFQVEKPSFLCHCLNPQRRKKNQVVLSFATSLLISISKLKHFHPCSWLA